MRPELETILQTLTHHCRVLTTQQIAKTLFTDRKRPIEAAHYAVWYLKKLGLVDTQRSSLTMIDPLRPLFCWSPGDVMPNLGAIAWLNSRRWQKARLRPMVCAFATGKGRLAQGGDCRPPRGHERQHDLTVASVYLRLLASGQAEGWRHEDTHQISAGSRPDATYVQAGQTVAVEVLGRGYTKGRIEAAWRVHRHGKLELW